MTDFQVFQQTSYEPYNRHSYEVVLKNKKRIKFSYYNEAQQYWFCNAQIPDYLDFIEVKDKKDKRGFG